MQIARKTVATGGLIIIATVLALVAMHFLVG